jgi:hypothetical protein
MAVVLQELSQAPGSSVQVGLDRADRDAEQLSDFWMRQAEVVMRHDALPLPEWKPGHGRGHDGGIVGRRCNVLNRGPADEAQRSGPILYSSPAEPAPSAVHDAAPEIADPASRIVERCDTPVQLGEALLNYVLATGGVAEDQGSEAHEVAVVGFEQGANKVPALAS